MCGGNKVPKKTFSVRKNELLGGQRPPQYLLASQRLTYVPWGGLWPPKRSWGGLRPPKSYIFLMENVSDTSLKICCAPAQRVLLLLTKLISVYINLDIIDTRLDGILYNIKIK